MNRRSILACTLLFAPLVAWADDPGSAPDASLAGSWELVSVANIQPDGTKREPYGPNPHGILMIDGAGRYAIEIYLPERPRFVSGDKGRGTAQEYEAAVQGSNAHFGRITVDLERRLLVFAIERATFPNWEGTEQRREFALDGDLLRYVVPEATAGKSVVGEVAWRRLP